MPSPEVSVSDVSELLKLMKEHNCTKMVFRGVEIHRLPNERAQQAPTRESEIERLSRMRSDQQDAALRLSPRGA